MQHSVTCNIRCLLMLSQIMFFFISGRCQELPPSQARLDLQPRSRSQPSPAAQAAAAGRPRRALPVETRVVGEAAAAGRSCPARTQQRRRSVCASADARWPGSPRRSKTFRLIDEAAWA